MSTVTNRLRLAAMDLRRAVKETQAALPFSFGPDQIQIILTDRCNYKCPTCSKWREQSAKDELMTDEWCSFLSKAVSMSSSRHVVFGGGEPLLRADIVDVIHHVTSLGMHSVIGTNGALLDEALLGRLQDAGLDFLMVSLNALDAAVHDASRGVPGSFEQVMRALELYRQAPGQLKMGIQTTIMQSNVSAIPALVDFVHEHDLHGIIFQAYMDDLMHGPFRENDHTFRDPRWFEQDSFAIRDISGAQRLIRELLSKQRSGWPILNPPSQLKAIADYFQAPATYKGIPCVCSVNGFLVDPYGKVRSCFRADPIGDIRTQDPQKIWKSQASQMTRRLVRDCHRPCRIMNRNY